MSEWTEVVLVMAPGAVFSVDTEAVRRPICAAENG